jgi:hypothetical protein
MHIYICLFFLRINSLFLILEEPLLMKNITALELDKVLYILSDHPRMLERDQVL